jgi:hypothetical protein
MPSNSALMNYRISYYATITIIFKKNLIKLYSFAFLRTQTHMKQTHQPNGNQQACRRPKVYFIKILSLVSGLNTCEEDTIYILCIGTIIQCVRKVAVHLGYGT